MLFQEYCGKSFGSHLSVETLTGGKPLGVYVSIVGVIGSYMKVKVTTAVGAFESGVTGTTAAVNIVGVVMTKQTVGIALSV